MNKKSTNYLVAVLNIISIVAVCIFIFSARYIMSGVEVGGKSIYDSFIIDILVNYFHVIVYSGIGIINIICAIQNKENKKISFWQFVFGLCCLYNGLEVTLLLTGIDKEITDWITKIIFSMFPIILAIINFIRIGKNKAKVIQIISYIVVIILCILDLLEIINTDLIETTNTYWYIIAAVMQLIYIHYQKNNIEESKSRKTINIILYYILQPLLAVGFLLMVLCSLLITKVNGDKWEDELIKLYNNISAMHGVTNNELYIPIEKDYKYGFINENGQEKIPCQYDRVSHFFEAEIGNSKFYIALAKKDTKFYIISKSNDVLIIDNALEKYLRMIYKILNSEIIDKVNINGNYRLGYCFAFEQCFRDLNSQSKIKLNSQMMNENITTTRIFLKEQNLKYYYNNKNYSMQIEHIYDGSENEKDYYNNYNECGIYYDNNGALHFSSYKAKYKVTISKKNGEINSSIVYLPNINENELFIWTFTNGYFEFENEDGTQRGWYDSDGNQVLIPFNYKIMDIKDDKVILEIKKSYDDKNYDPNNKINFIITDMMGKILLQTQAIIIYDNMYLVKNNNKKMVLLDKKLNAITKEYDRINTSSTTDVLPEYCSYYQQ